MIPPGIVLLATSLAPVRLAGGLVGLDERPILSGAEQTRASGDFVVHWTEEGTDAIPDADMPDRVLTALVDSAAAYDAQGWRPLVADAGGGGSDAIDLYIRGVDINGYAHGVEIDGEDGRGSCWMEVEADLGDLGGLVLESVVAHELHHCIQYRYTWDTASWLHESTSTWVQYRAYESSALTIALAALYATRLSEPGRPIDDLTGRYEYAGFVFVKLWTELHGTDPDRAVALWEALAVEPQWREGLETASEAAFGQPLAATTLDYATWNAFACARDDGAHYDPDTLACTADLSVPITALEPSFALTLDDGDHATAYGSLPAGDPVVARCDVTGPAALRLVAVDADGVAGEAVDAYGEGALELALTQAAAGEVLFVAVATDRDGITVSCDTERVAPIVEEGCGCRTGGGSGAVWLPLLWLVRRRR